MDIPYHPREKTSDIVKRAFSRWGKILTGQSLDQEDISSFTWPIQNPPAGISEAHEYTARRNSEGKWDLIYSTTELNTGTTVHSLPLTNVGLKDVVSYIYLRETPRFGPGLFTPPSDLRRVAEMVGYEPPQMNMNEWRPKNSPRIP